MRMARDEKLWRRGIDLSSDGGIIVAGITADMLHKHIGVLASESELFGKHESEVAPIAVAADGSEGSEGSKSVCNLRTADVARMPYLVAGLEITEVFVVPECVGIAYDSYSFH